MFNLLKNKSIWSSTLTIRISASDNTVYLRVSYYFLKNNIFLNIINGTDV
jgi:hypothetical protein